MKTCTSCEKEKPLEEFSKNSKRGHHAWCKGCVREYRQKNAKEIGVQQKEYRRNNPVKIKEMAWKRRYGITAEDYNQMFSEQEGCCAICKRHQSEFKIALAVDHCHTTSRVRGLLCLDCNIGIGKLKDDISLLQSAIDYLKEGV